jgi:hypothetical protein
MFAFSGVPLAEGGREEWGEFAQAGGVAIEMEMERLGGGTSWSLGKAENGSEVSVTAPVGCRHGRPNASSTGACSKGASKVVLGLPMVISFHLESLCHQGAWYIRTLRGRIVQLTILESQDSVSVILDRSMGRKCDFTPSQEVRAVIFDLGLCEEDADKP